MNKKKRPIDVYVTRDSYMRCVYIYPAIVGIRKFHGCIAWGAAWCKTDDRTSLSARINAKQAERLDEPQCRTRFGFYPSKGTAWLVKYNAKGKMKKSKVDIDFSP